MRGPDREACVNRWLIESCKWFGAEKEKCVWQKQKDTDPVKVYVIKEQKKMPNRSRTNITFPIY